MVIPVAGLTLFVADRIVSLRRLVGDVEAVVVLCFFMGFVVAAVATVESVLRGRRLILPLISLGLRLCGVLLAVAVFIWVDQHTRSHGGPR